MVIVKPEIHLAAVKDSLSAGLHNFVLGGFGGGCDWREWMQKIDMWMPFYPGDYLRDTVDLTRAEHGTYLLTMIAYWTNGESLPDRKFRAICGKEYERVMEFYVECDGRWHHKRIDMELRLARERVKAAAEKARKMVEARRKAGQLPAKGDSNDGKAS